MTYEYIAGFFDGEGCVSISKTHQTSFNLRIGIAQKRRKILEEIIDFFGYGKIGPVGRHRAPFLYFDSKKALNFLEGVLPFLRVKNLSANLGIQFQRNKEDGRKVKRLSDKEIRWRNMHYELMKIYNHII